MEINNKMLRELVHDAKVEGELSEELAIAAMRIACRYMTSEKWSNLSFDDKNEVVSLFNLKFVRKWEKLNDRNPFSYITQMVNNTALDYIRKVTYRVNFFHVDKAPHIAVYQEHNFNDEPCYECEQDSCSGCLFEGKFMEA